PGGEGGHPRLPDDEPGMGGALHEDLVARHRGRLHRVTSRRPRPRVRDTGRHRHVCRHLEDQVGRQAAGQRSNRRGRGPERRARRARSPHQRPVHHMTAERNDTESEDYEREDLNREVLSVQIKDRLLQWIMEGELPPGSRIVETRIARRLGVSQAPVREALRDLASVGIVQVEPYRGAFVRRPSPDELAEAMPLRGELAALGARWAVERITDEDLVELRRLIDAMDRAAAAHDTHAHALHNTTFHQRIMEASGNRSLLWVWSLLEPMARTYYTAAVSGADLGWL